MVGGYSCCQALGLLEVQVRQWGASSVSTLPFQSLRGALATIYLNQIQRKGVTQATDGKRTMQANNKPSAAHSIYIAAQGHLTSSTTYGTTHSCNTQCVTMGVVAAWLCLRLFSTWVQRKHLGENRIKLPRGGGEGPSPSCTARSRMLRV